MKFNFLGYRVNGCYGKLSYKPIGFSSERIGRIEHSFLSLPFYTLCWYRKK
jgi:hypothetical protein